MICSAQIGCEQHSLSEQSVIPSSKTGGEREKKKLEKIENYTAIK